MSDSSYSLLDPKDKRNLDKRALSIQNNTSPELQTHEKLKCNSVHFYFDALSLFFFFKTHKYLMKWAQTEAI